MNKIVNMGNVDMINSAITFPQVRLIGPDGQQLGIVSNAEAQQKAQEYNLDLVLVTDKASPPVCKILDFGKYKYEQSKRKKEAAKASRASRVETKELWLRPVTEQHDIDIKVKKALEFLAKGNRVKVGVKFRGRELRHKEQGKELLEGFLKSLGSVRVEKSLQAQERNIFFVVSSEKK